MTITPIIKIEREKMGAMGILQVIDDGIFVCICRVYLGVFKNTSKAFIYESYSAQLKKSECCGAIIDNISYAPIGVLEEKDRKIQSELNNILGFFKVCCIVDYAFKVITKCF